MALPKRLLSRIEAYPPFLRAVWRACAEIPPGSVRSYGWVARRIGRPGAARAVGQALKKNPFAPAVPCHRVVPQASLAAGKLRPGAPLGGYNGPAGTPRKRRLLVKEGAIPSR